MAEKQTPTKPKRAPRKKVEVERPEIESEEAMVPTSFDETGNNKYAKQRRVGDRESKTVGRPSQLVTRVGLGKLTVKTYE